VILNSCCARIGCWKAPIHYREARQRSATQAIDQLLQKQNLPHHSLDLPVMTAQMISSMAAAFILKHIAGYGAACFREFRLSLIHPLSACSTAAAEAA
jgi:hypothetical protein